MILLSNGGTNQHRNRQSSDTMAIGTVDGVVVLERAAGAWSIKHRALAGVSVSAVTSLDDGTLFAATHGVGSPAATMAARPGRGPMMGSIASISGPRGPAA